MYLFLIPAQNHWICKRIWGDYTLAFALPLFVLFLLLANVVDCVLIMWKSRKNLKFFLLFHIKRKEKALCKALQVCGPLHSFLSWAAEKVGVYPGVGNRSSAEEKSFLVTWRLCVVRCRPSCLKVFQHLKRRVHDFGNLEVLLTNTQNSAWSPVGA